MRNYFLSFIIFFLGRKILYNLNLNIIKLFSVFIGNNIFFSAKVSGENYFLREICKEKPNLCIDVGANIGKYSKFILMNSKSKIIAFEPSKMCFKELNRLKKKFPNKINIFYFGLGNNNKNLNLYYDKKNSLWSNYNPQVQNIYYLKNTNLIEKSKIKKLDKVYNDNKKKFNLDITLLKIDTEGYEYDVLLGARNFIKNKKPKYIQIEYNWHHLFKNISLYKISKLLNNYDVYKILPYSSGLLKIDPKKPENNYYNYSNYVFKLKK
jgi:FkbM family methyltransferase